MRTAGAHGGGIAAAIVLGVLALPCVCVSAQSNDHSNTTTCPRALDIIFVVDSSNSISDSQWAQFRSFVADFALRFEWGPNRADMAMIAFAQSAYMVRPFNLSSSAQEFAAAARNASAQGRGRTHTYAALAAANAHFVSAGRDPATTGVARITVVLTDGQSSNTTQTVDAANAMRAAGIDVAAVTVNVTNANPEIIGIVGGNTQLWVAVENWSALTAANTTNALVSGICAVPSTINSANSTINGNVACNTTQTFQYTTIPGPLLLSANTSGGMAVLCYSFFNTQPVPPGGIGVNSSGPTYCSRSSNQTIQMTAIPQLNRTTMPPQFNLWVSLTAVGSSDIDACGVNFTLNTGNCAVKIALNASVIGDRNATIDPNTPLNLTTFGVPGAPVCPVCPDGTAFLATAGRLSTICGASCLGSAQFFERTGAVVACADCHASCASCQLPGTARSCTGCSNPAAPRLLTNMLDPAFTSPYWTAEDNYISVATNGAVSSVRGDAAIRAQIAPANTSVAGRCVPACPLSSRWQRRQLEVSTGLLTGTRCNADIATWAAATITVQIALCVSTSSNGISSCASFATSAANIRTSFQLSQMLGVPLTSIFLRACVDVEGVARSIYSFNSSLLPTAGGGISEPAVDALVASVTPCECRFVGVYAVNVGVAAPAPGSSLFDLAYAMTEVTTDTVQQYQRTDTLMSLLSSRNSSAFSPNCSVSQQRGNNPIFLGSCPDTTAATDGWGSENVALRDPITACLLASPTPFPTASTEATSTASSSSTISPSATMTQSMASLSGSASPSPSRSASPSASPSFSSPSPTPSQHAEITGTVTTTTSRSPSAVVSPASGSSSLTHSPSVPSVMPTHPFHNSSSTAHPPGPSTATLSLTSSATSTSSVTPSNGSAPFVPPNVNPINEGVTDILSPAGKAGVSLVAIAAVGLLAAAFLWWKRRRSSSANARPKSLRVDMKNPMVMSVKQGGAGDAVEGPGGNNSARRTSKVAFGRSQSRLLDSADVELAAVVLPAAQQGSAAISPLSVAPVMVAPWAAFGQAHRRMESRSQRTQFLSVRGMEPDQSPSKSRE